jgi:hypothetical protein
VLLRNVSDNKIDPSRNGEAKGARIPDLAVAAMLRDVAGPPEQTDADVTRMFTRAMTWRECPVSEDRMVEVNQLSLAFFRRHFPTSWGRNIWPAGSAQTSPTTSDSSLVKHQ